MHYHHKDLVFGDAMKQQYKRQFSRDLTILQLRSLGCTLPYHPRFSHALGC
jgi:hypothetical protein